MGLRRGPLPRDKAAMFDAVTLDQLRMLVAVADEGSFSGAARRLRRVQSAVSQAMAKLESQLEVVVWSRDTRVPLLTDEGRVVLAAARRVLHEADELARVARGITGGIETSVALCVDAVFPTDALVALCRGFVAAHPEVELRVYTESMSAVSAMVRDGAAQLGVVGPAADASGLVRHHLTTVRMIPVCAPEHPLAKTAASAKRRPISSAEIGRHVQVVLGERGDPTSTARGKTPDQAVLSPRSWRVVELATKHALLLGGLGWGNMPEHVVRDDLAQGRLVKLRLEAWGEDEHLLSLAAVHTPEQALGPATRWLLEAMPELCGQVVRGPGRAPSKKGPTRTRSARPGPARPRRS